MILDWNASCHPTENSSENVCTPVKVSTLETSWVCAIPSPTTQTGRISKLYPTVASHFPSSTILDVSCHPEINFSENVNDVGNFLSERDSGNFDEMKKFHHDINPPHPKLMN
uniref:Uncharacterized protein n=1 Tax=Attheya septentrionalis TaxID=420275 RepID=A0A7S2USH1_9STRA